MSKSLDHESQKEDVRRDVKKVEVWQNGARRHSGGSRVTSSVSGHHLQRMRFYHSSSIPPAISSLPLIQPFLGRRAVPPLARPPATTFAYARRSNKLSQLISVRALINLDRKDILVTLLRLSCSVLMTFRM